ncbi:hypothetical protein E4U55_003180 [Claviceps digitariae]|nr:hypothetical protein E4U55_003180 [Claviceps digitariae]
MAFLKTILFLGAVSGQALAIEAPIPGYGVADLAWDINLNHGDAPLNLTGTIEQVQAQIKQLNPRWTPASQEKQPREAHDEEHLLARAEPLKVYCSNRGEKWGFGETRRINEGIEYLHEISGTPTNGPGPGMCARNDHEYKLDSYKEVASAAQAIVDKCARGYRRAVVKGQAFMPGDWNVVIKWDMANC